MPAKTKKKPKKRTKILVKDGIEIDDVKKLCRKYNICALLKRPKRKKKGVITTTSKTINIPPLARSILKQRTLQSSVDGAIRNYAKFLGYNKKELESKKIKELESQIKKLSTKQQQEVVQGLRQSQILNTERKTKPILSKTGVRQVDIQPKTKTTKATQTETKSTSSSTQTPLPGSLEAMTTGEKKVALEMINRKLGNLKTSLSSVEKQKQTAKLDEKRETLLTDISDINESIRELKESIAEDEKEEEQSGEGQIGGMEADDIFQNYMDQISDFVDGLVANRNLTPVQRENRVRQFYSGVEETLVDDIDQRRITRAQMREFSDSLLNDMIDDINRVNPQVQIRQEAMKGGYDKLLNARKGDDGLFDHEIDDIMKGVDDYVGCVASDQVRNIQIKKDMNFVVNLDKSTEGGSHWVACRVDSKAKSVEYYDPLGDAPQKNIDKQLHDIVDKLDPEEQYKYKINRKKNQDSTTSTCGHFCCLFLMSREDGMSWMEATEFGEDDVEKERQNGGLKGFGYI